MDEESKIFLTWLIVGTVGITACVIVGLQRDLAIHRSAFENGYEQRTLAGASTAKWVKATTKETP